MEFLLAHEEGQTTRSRPQAEPPEVRARGSHPKSPASPSETPQGTLLITAKEAAKYLSIGERTLWQMSAPRGPIPCVRFGGAVRYPVDDLKTVVKRMSARGT
ncbi:MAG: helix-turn-helix domain-containing protein [Tepidisphaera sp.]